MYGLIGKMLATPGNRDALAEILLQGIAGMPGCLSYIVAQDPTNPDALWVTEVWASQAEHQASLSLPSVRAAITQARPIIAGFGERFETTGAATWVRALADRRRLDPANAARALAEPGCVGLLLEWHEAGWLHLSEF